MHDTIYVVILNVWFIYKMMWCEDTDIWNEISFKKGKFNTTLVTGGGDK